MLPIGNLTVFLSVPPSYQYLHSLIHHSPFTFHLFTTHHSRFTLSHFTYSPLTIHSSSHFSFGLLRKSTLLSEEYPKDYRTTSEGKWKRGGQIWSNMDKRGQRWSNLDKRGQTWTELDKHGQRWTNLVRTGQITQGKCLVFSCVISLGNHSKKI